MKTTFFTLAFLLLGLTTAEATTIRVNCGELTKVRKTTKPVFPVNFPLSLVATKRDAISATLRNGVELVHTRGDQEVRQENEFKKLRAIESYKFTRNLEKHYDELAEIIQEQNRTKRTQYTCYGSIIGVTRWHRIVSSSQLSIEDAFKQLINRYQK